MILARATRCGFSFLLAVAALCPAADGPQTALRPDATPDRRSQLMDQADRLLEADPPSITQKPAAPPGGSKNDYMSQSIYWWPNPINGGRPYIYLDGTRNPESDQFDAPKVTDFAEKLTILSEAYALSGESRYAQAARTWLRTWFLDEETRMNPNLEHAQAVPGWSDGTPMGILEGLPLARKIPAVVAALYAGGELPEAEYRGIREWFRRYADWLAKSPKGRFASDSDNNHGTWYDVQLVSCHKFLDEPERAKEILRNVGIRRVSKQIEPDGRQPAELVRTRPIEYSLYNLDAFLSLCELAASLNLDLLGYQSPAGASIGKAIEFLETNAPGIAKERGVEANSAALTKLRERAARLEPAKDLRN